MTDVSLRACWIVPCDGPPLADGVLEIHDGRIASLRSARGFPGPVRDLGDVAVFPGLVNAHTHLEFSDCRQPLGQSCLPLPTWIRQIISERRRSNRTPAAAIRQGLDESLCSGVTTIGEIATQPLSVYGDFIGSQLVVFHEVIGFSAARCESVLSDLKKRLRPATNDRIVQGISPHAPYTVHPQLLRSLVDLARELDLPLAMHLAESREELQLLRTGDGPFRDLLNERSMWDPQAIPRDSRPLDYLALLAEAPRSLVIHGNYLDGEEVAFLAQHRDRMSLVYCSRTHAYFAHEAYPLAQLLAAGVRVVLGTDSRASNPDLNLLAEMRETARLHPDVSPADILKMATQSSATGLDLDGQIGTLRPGTWADLVVLPCSANAAPIEAIVLGESQPVQVFVRGVLQ